MPVRYDSTSDFDLDSANANPTGITFGNNKFWVADATDNKVYAYNADGSRDTASDFDLDSANANPTGITFGNNKFWVINTISLAGNRVYAYNADGSRDTASDFDLDSINTSPVGITFGNNKFWVVDSSDNKVYAYNADGSRDDDASDFDLDSANANPTGITFGNNKFWVVDSSDNKVYAYNADGSRDDDASDFDLDSANANPTGITFGNNKFWVINAINITDDKVYGYILLTRVAKSLTSKYSIRNLVTNSKKIIDVSTSTYDNKSFSVSSQETQPSALAFNNDLSKVYVIGFTTDTIYQYSLSTPGDISTATYDNKSFSVSSQEVIPTGLAFNNDLSKVYVVGFNTDKIYQYSLSTPGDISTATYDNKSFSVRSQESQPSDLAFNNDLSKVYVVGYATDTIHQYTLSTPGDISTATYDNKSFSVNSQDSNPSDLAFNNDLSKVYVVGIVNNKIHQYSLSTPGDISTATYDNKSFSVSSQESQPRDLAFNNDLSKVYVVGLTTAIIYQYSVSEVINHLTSQYKIVGRIGRSIISKFKIAGRIEKSLTSKYSIRNLTAKSLTSKYQIAGKVLKSVTSLYIIENLVRKSIASKYHIRESVEKSVTSKYTILGRIEKSLTSKYSIRNLTAKSLTSKYQIAGKVLKSVTSRYIIKNLVRKSIASKYHIRESVEKSVTSKYTILGRIEKSIASKYQILSRITKQVASKYTIEGFVTKILTSQYKIVGKVKKSLTSKYSIRELTSNTKIIFLSSASDDTITRVYGLSVDAENDYVYFTSETNSIIRYILSEFQNGVFTSKTIFPNPTDFGYGDSIVRDNNKTYLAFANTTTLIEIAVFNDNGVILTNEGFDISNISIAHFAITIKDGFLYVIGKSISESTKLIVEAYNISTKQRDAAKSYKITDAPNLQPFALALLDDTMYIKFFQFNNIYAYDIGSSVSDPDKIILGYNYYDETEPNQSVFGFSISDGKFFMINEIAALESQLLTFNILKPLASQYRIISRVKKSVTSKFKIAGRIEKSLTSKYSIRNIVTNSEIIKDVSTAVYNNKSYSIGEFTAPTGCTFNRDMSKVWITGKDALFIYQYSLSTPGDITTATYDNKRIGVSAGTQGISFNSDYSRMYLINSSIDKIMQYNLSTPEDISTATLVSSYSVAGQEAGPRGIAVNSDVSKIWIVGSGMRTVYQYSLSIPGNLTTISFNNKSFAVNSQATFPQGITFNEDENMMWVVGSSSDGIHQYTLSTAGDVSTASYDGLFYSLSGISTNPTDVKFNDDFTAMYVTGQHTNRIYQFAIPESILTLASKYSIVGKVLKSVTSLYIIENLVSKSLNSKYIITERVSKQVNSKFSILEKVAKSLTSKYSIRNLTAKSLTSKYSIIGVVKKIVTSQYQVVGKVKKSLTSKYQIRELTSKVLTSKYSIRELTSKVLNSQYEIFSRISKALTSQYRIAGRVVKSLTSQYKIVGRIAKSLISKYDIFGRVVNSLTSQYEITSRVTKTTTSQYDIRETISKILTSKFSIIGRVVHAITSRYYIGDIELPVSGELKLLTTVKSFKLLTPTKQTMRIQR